MVAGFSSSKSVLFAVEMSCWPRPSLWISICTELIHSSVVDQIDYRWIGAWSSCSMPLLRMRRKAIVPNCLVVRHRFMSRFAIIETTKRSICLVLEYNAELALKLLSLVCLSWPVMGHFVPESTLFYVFSHFFSSVACVQYAMYRWYDIIQSFDFQVTVSSLVVALILLGSWTSLQ